MWGLVLYLVLLGAFLVCYLGIEFGKWQASRSDTDRENPLENGNPLEKMP